MLGTIVPGNPSCQARSSAFRAASAVLDVSMYSSLDTVGEIWERRWIRLLDDDSYACWKHQPPAFRIPLGNQLRMDLHYPAVHRGSTPFSDARPANYAVVSESTCYRRRLCLDDTPTHPIRERADWQTRPRSLLVIPSRNRHRLKSGGETTWWAYWPIWCDPPSPGRPSMEVLLMMPNPTR